MRLKLIKNRASIGKVIRNEKFKRDKVSLHKFGSENRFTSVHLSIR